MKLTHIAAIAALALVMTAPVARAHHSFSAEFDVNKPIKLQGTLTKWEMVNPHSWFHIDVKGPDGKVSSWLVEGGSPNQLIRMGVTKNTVPAGTELLIEAYQSKDGNNKAVGRNFVLADGKPLFLGGSAPGGGGDSTPSAAK